MTKRKKRKARRKRIGLKGEAKYIIRQAQLHDARLVIHDTLIFFSTATGDAWMLDPEDNLALCLARDGVEQDFTIFETADSWGVAWNATYFIEGEAFVVLDNTGQLRTIIGYPTDDILHAIERIEAWRASKP